MKKKKKMKKKKMSLNQDIFILKKISIAQKKISMSIKKLFVVIFVKHALINALYAQQVKLVAELIYLLTKNAFQKRLMLMYVIYVMLKELQVIH